MRRSFFTSAMIVVLAMFSTARAQLVPDRLYYGVGRSIPMSITLPEEAAGEVSIRLFLPVHPERGEYQLVAQAAAAAGRVDLATMFPSLWTERDHRLLYAQLYIGESPLGPAVILQPLLTPDRAHLMAQTVITDPATGQQVVIPQITTDPTRGRAMFETEQIAMLRAAGRPAPDREVTFSGIRAYVDRRVILDTTLGEIEIMLRPDAAPNTAYNFLHLVNGGFYTDIIFHRIVPLASNGSPFVIQVGDPTGAGEGGPGYMIDLEPSTVAHAFGVISMARSSDPDTNGSQVFICLSREGTRHLDGQYTSFGHTVRGADVIQAIAATPVDAQGRSDDPPVLRSARLVAAPPIGTGPLPVAEPTTPPIER